MSAKKVENAVLVTGGGQRIGEYLVRQFLAKDDFPVVFTYRTERPQIDELQRLGALALKVDFTDSLQLEQAVDSLLHQVGSLRAIIHNASLWLSDEQAPVGSAEYQSLFQIHVDAPMYLNHRLAHLFHHSDSELKDIISISDYSVLRVKESHIAYLASKSALRTLSQAYAKKLAPEIKVNDIAPALIAFNEGDDEGYKEQRLSQSALPIEPGPEVIWQAVNYLFNNCYSTGTVLQLDGGRNLV